MATSKCIFLLFRLNKVFLYLFVLRYNSFTNFTGEKKLVKVKRLYSQNFSKHVPLKSDRGGFEFCHNLYMNCGKYTYESDFESHKYFLHCGNDIFPYQMTKMWTIKPPSLLDLKKTKKLNLFLKLCIKWNLSSICH